MLCYPPIDLPVFQVDTVMLFRRVLINICVCILYPGYVPIPSVHLNWNLYVCNKFPLHQEQHAVLLLKPAVTCNRLENLHFPMALLQIYVCFWRKSCYPCLQWSSVSTVVSFSPSNMLPPLNTQNAIQKWIFDFYCILRGWYSILIHNFLFNFKGNFSLWFITDHSEMNSGTS